MVIRKSYFQFDVDEYGIPISKVCPLHRIPLLIDYMYKNEMYYKMKLYKRYASSRSEVKTSILEDI